MGSQDAPATLTGHPLGDAGRLATGGGFRATLLRHPPWFDTNWRLEAICADPETACDAVSPSHARCPGSALLSLAVTSEVPSLATWCNLCGRHYERHRNNHDLVVVLGLRGVTNAT